MPRALRLLLTPHWILRTVVAVVAIVACGVAALWQYHRTEDQLAVARAALSELVAYEAVVPADSQSLDIEWLGRNVTVTGVVLPERSLIRSRLSRDGAVGYLVVDPVRLDDGRVVAVLQGWVPDAASAPDLAGQRVSVDGRLQPYENFYAGAPITADEPLLTISAAGLAEQWRQPPVDGYVTVTGPPAAPQLGAVTPLVGTDPDVPFPLQNAFYSLQWLIFAGLICYAWQRFFREDLRTEAGGEPAAIPADADDRVSL